MTVKDLSFFAVSCLVFNMTTLVSVHVKFCSHLCGRT